MQRSGRPTHICLVLLHNDSENKKYTTISLVKSKINTVIQSENNHKVFSAEICSFIFPPLSSGMVACAVNYDDYLQLLTGIKQKI